MDLPPVVAVLGEVLTEMCQVQNSRQRNRKESTYNSQKSTAPFSARPPAISVQLYLKRLWDYAECSKHCFVVSAIYVDRLQKRQSVVIDDLSVHRLFLTGLAVASKFLDDRAKRNDHWAHVGGISMAEMNRLEYRFLVALDYDLIISKRQYWQYQSEMRNFYRIIAPSPATCHSHASPGTETTSEEAEPDAATDNDSALSAESKEPSLASPSPDLMETRRLSQLSLHGIGVSPSSTPSEPLYIPYH